jgi:hypothetical protein
MTIRGNGKQRNTDLIASASQMWRLNETGCVQLRSEPGDPISREVAKALLRELADRGVWQPQPRAGKT